MPLLVPLIFTLVGSFFPRILMVVLWFTTDWIERAYGGLLIPLLGLIFMPYTALWYAAVQNWYGGVWGPIPIVVMVLAVAGDLSGWNSYRGYGRRL